MFEKLRYLLKVINSVKKIQYPKDLSVSGTGLFYRFYDFYFYDKDTGPSGKHGSRMYQMFVLNTVPCRHLFGCGPGAIME